VYEPSAIYVTSLGGLIPSLLALNVTLTVQVEAELFNLLTVTFRLRHH